MEDDGSGDMTGGESTGSSGSGSGSGGFNFGNVTSGLGSAVGGYFSAQAAGKNAKATTALAKTLMTVGVILAVVIGVALIFKRK